MVRITFVLFQFSLMEIFLLCCRFSCPASYSLPDRVHSFRLVSSDSLTEDTEQRAPHPTTPAFSKCPQLKYQPECAARKSMQRFVYLIPHLCRHAKKACDDFFSLPSTTSKCILRRKLLHAASYFSVYANFNSTSGDNKRGGGGSGLQSLTKQRFSTRRKLQIYNGNAPPSPNPPHAQSRHGCVHNFYASSKSGQTRGISAPQLPLSSSRSSFLPCATPKLQRRKIAMHWGLAAQ